MPLHRLELPMTRIWCSQSQSQSQSRLRCVLYPLALALLLLPQGKEAATARGPSRAYRGAARRRRGGVVANIGGGESMVEDYIRKVEMTNQVKEMAEQGQEFVFHSKEDVDAVFRCTACIRAVQYLGRSIIGRLEIGMARKRKKAKASVSGPYRGSRGKIRKRIRNLINQVCSRKDVFKDRDTMNQCPSFVQASGGHLEDMFLDRCDPEDEHFEDDIDATGVCKSQLLTDENTCAPGVKSMSELLASRLNSINGEKRDKNRKMYLEKKRKEDEEREREEGRKAKALLDKQSSLGKRKKRLVQHVGKQAISGGKGVASSKKEAKKKTRTVVRRVRRVRRIPRRTKAPQAPSQILEYVAKPKNADKQQEGSVDEL